MIKRNGFFLSVFLGLAMSFSGISDAEAKRFGGGGSFGGKSSFSSPFKRQTGSMAPTRSASQQKATQQNQAARQNLSKRGGLMGMLGGLAIGGLLGAMLFGGAFENINFMDILIFGGIAYLLYRLLAAKRASMTPRPAYQRATPDAARSQDEQRPAAGTGQGNDARFDTGDWFRGGAAGATGVSPPRAEAGEDADFERPGMPIDFDVPAFLAGAKVAYGALQKAWDTRDLAEIRSLTTDSMFGEIQDRIKSLEADNRTDVLKLEAELLDAREVGDTLEAVVLFDAIMREAADDKARQVREVWHFTKPKISARPTWFLDGIQQMED